jgi:hypothetical protein
MRVRVPPEILIRKIFCNNVIRENENIAKKMLDRIFFS